MARPVLLAVDDQLRTLTIRDGATAAVEELRSDALFVLIGGEPRTIKRVGSAVGEGATAVRLVHDYLADDVVPAAG